MEENNNAVTLSDENHIKLKLRSFTGTVMEIGLSAAKMSLLIRNMIETFSADKQLDYDKPIPLENDALNDTALKKIIEWCEYHWDDPEVDEEFEDEKLNCSQELSHWDKQFIDVDDQALLYDIIVGANYMDIKGLVEVGGKHICNKIKGKTCEEVRQILRIENDFTEKEEKQIYEENEWIYAKD